MALYALIILVAVFFLTSLIGVVTGSNSLIAVPVMFQLGIDPKVAVATNMFGLVFMSIGGTIPFVRQKKIEYDKLSPFVLITVISSTLGALLVGVLSSDSIKLIVSAAMIFVALFTLVRHKTGVSDEVQPGRFALPVTYVLTFILGIYGGLFSGGYVTMLTAVLVGIYGMRYGEAVASTKLINVFSSLIATIVFMWQGLVDYKLGLIIGAAMFAGAYVGAHYATKLNDVWLRRIFLTTVLLLAAKTLYDFI
ncbi:MAG: sulfite exporter TauE/SafE family protein [Pyrinomonadaceae bacterium]|nr:sulfite exporter TauE/SafE family protein [Acidobacteriota bacterium]MBP7474860.1 sulfite exporter TauE/SafE family protein [Pyrinomonadaceae bacterium]MBP9110421.1 sulfite exporter TauE/SafE family protein [Pyrinomonadaceae bacterium]